MLHAAAPQSQSPEGGNGTSNSSGGDVAPAGFVIANDSDAQRCNLLVHQTKRMCSPCLMVTNHNGQDFPRIADASGTAMEFDRILCDVPCSGDGTMRKAPDIWRRWTVNNGNGLHSLQLRIVMHAARLLKVWEDSAYVIFCLLLAAVLYACYADDQLSFMQKHAVLKTAISFCVQYPCAGRRASCLLHLHLQSSGG